MSSLLLAPAHVDDPAARLLLAEYAQELYARWDAPPLEERQSDAADIGLGPPTGVFLLARIGGDPAGCVGLRTLDPGTGEVKRMFVRSEHRGRGLARQLLVAVEAEARARGLARLRLDTMAQLVEARAPYLDAGYQDIEAYNANPYASHWMEKALS